MHTPLTSNPTSIKPIISQPYNIDKITLEQIDRLHITLLLSTGRSASTLLATMMMMHEEIIFCNEEIFPIILYPKYSKIKLWSDKIIQNYCNDFILMSEGKLYPLFCGKEILMKLLMKFKEHLNYERVIKLSYLAFGINKDLSKVTTIIDKQLKYFLTHYYIKLYNNPKVILLVRDPRDNIYTKYKRYLRKNIVPKPCNYIHTWNEAYQTYLKVLNKKFLLIHYEDLILNKENCLKQISEYIQVPYTKSFFEYNNVVTEFLEKIEYPPLKEYFISSHQSMSRPIMPNKINEWQQQMNDDKIKTIIDSTWKITQHVASQFNYLPHPDFNKKIKTIKCFFQYIKIKSTPIITILYFEILPYTLKKIIKKIKYPSRINAVTAYDGYFLKETM